MIRRPSRQRGHRCVICRKNKNDCESLKLHRFPKDVGRCKEWVKALNIPCLKRVSPLQLNNSYVVCSNHFRDDQYLNGRLLYSSVPVKHLTAIGMDDFDDEMSDLEEQDLTAIGMDNSDDEMSDLEEQVSVTSEREVDKAMIRVVDQSFLYNSEDWNFRGFSPGCFDRSGEISDEVRVGPSFSRFNTPTEGNQGSSHQGFEGVGLEIFDPGVKVNIEKTSHSPLEADERFFESDDNTNSSSESTSTGNALDSTLKCLVTDGSLNLVRKDGTVIREPKKIVSHMPDELVTSFFQQRLKEKRLQKKVAKSQNLLSTNIFALSTHSKNPKAYSFMKNIFALPSVEILKQWKRTIDFDNGLLHSDLILLLKQRALALTLEERLCGIVFHIFKVDSDSHDKFSAESKEELHQRQSNDIDTYENKFLSHALVIMMKGVNRNWRHVLGFHMLDSKMENDFVKQILEVYVVKLKGIGYTVKFMSCSYEPQCCSVKDLFRVTPEKPYFTVGEEKIYFYFDPEDLALSILKEFARNDIGIRCEVARWDFIKAFLEKDSQQDLSIGPRLDLVMESLSCDQFLNIHKKILPKLFSHAVASGIYMYATSGVLPKEAVHTSEFIYTFSKLLSCFGISEIHHSKIQSRQKFLENIEFLEKHRFVINNFKFVSEASENPNKFTPVNSHCLQCFKINVNGFLEMWRELHIDLKMAKVNVPRFVKNCLSNLTFKDIDGNPSQTVPTLSTFEATMKRIITKSFMQYSHYEDFQSYVSSYMSGEK